MKNITEHLREYVYKSVHCCACVQLYTAYYKGMKKKIQVYFLFEGSE